MGGQEGGRTERRKSPKILGIGCPRHSVSWQLPTLEVCPFIKISSCAVHQDIVLVQGCSLVFITNNWCALP